MRLFYLLLFLLLSYPAFLFAQKDKGFSLELTTAIGYSNFLLDANELDPLWANSGIHTKTNGGLLLGFGIGVAKPLNDRFHLRMNFLLYKGAFVYKMEGLRFETDILNPVGGGDNTSTLQANFQFLSLEVPFSVDYYLSSQLSTYLISFGAGGVKNLNSKDRTVLHYSDGREEEINTPSYLAREFNSYALLGFGKKIPLADTNREMLLRATCKYYFLKEGLNFFDTTGRLINADLEIAFRF